MGKIRETIMDGAFGAFREEFLSGYRTTDEQVRLDQKQKWLRKRETDTLPDHS
jgi:hypothetical protein